jgi:hypothetical protein
MILLLRWNPFLTMLLFVVAAVVDEPTNSPLNLCQNGPYGDKFENFRHYRYVEIKHGRTCTTITTTC